MTSFETASCLVYQNIQCVTVMMSKSLNFFSFANWNVSYFSVCLYVRVCVWLCPAQNPDDQLETQSSSVEMTNISSLPLTAHLSLKHPFMLQLEDDGQFFITTEYVRTTCEIILLSCFCKVTRQLMDKNLALF